MIRFPTGPAIAFILVLTLPAAIPVEAAGDPGERAFALYLDDGSLTPHRPSDDGPARNRTLAPIVHSTVCQPVVSQLPPGTIPSTGKGCPWTWGSWESPASIRFFVHKTKVADDTPFREGSLTLWFNATAPVGVVQLSVALFRVYKGGAEAPLYTWNYDPSDASRVSPAGATVGTPRQAQDAETGAPFIIIHNRSVPLSLKAATHTPSAFAMRVDPGQSLALRFTKVITANLNSSLAAEDAEAPSADLRIEYGSLDRASAFTAFLEPSSAYHNAAILGLFVDDAETLARVLPTAKDPKRIPIQYEPDPNRTGNVTLGSVILDEPFELGGNALAYLYTQIEYTNPPSAGAKPLLVGSPLRLRVELELVAGVDVITSTADAYNADVEMCNAFGQGNPGPCPYSRHVLALPTAGRTLPSGEPVTLQARLLGVDFPQGVKMYVIYGSAAAPTGLKLPYVPRDEGFRFEASPPDPPLPNAGVGVSNGTYSLEADRLLARVAAGSHTSITLTVRNRNDSHVQFAGNLGGRPEAATIDLDPWEGSLFPHASQRLELTVAIADSAPLNAFELLVNATFTPVLEGGALASTPVGPLIITIVVDEAAGAEGDPPLASAPLSTEAHGSPAEDDASITVKAISREHQAVSGAGSLALAAGLVVSLAFARRRTG